MRTETSGPHDVVPVDLAVVAAVCDTLLPALSTDADGAYGDYLRRGASERDIPASVAAAVPNLPPHVAGAVRGLLEELAAEGFADASLDARTERLRRAGDDVPTGRLALKQLKTMVFGQFFGAFDEELRNPAWEVIGFPGPVTPPPTPEQAPKTIPIERVSGDDAVLTADVCVVGSGAGGSVDRRAPRAGGQVGPRARGGRATATRRTSASSRR